MATYDATTKSKASNRITSCLVTYINGLIESLDITIEETLIISFANAQVILL